MRQTLRRVWFLRFISNAFRQYGISPLHVNEEVAELRNTAASLMQQLTDRKAAYEIAKNRNGKIPRQSGLARRKIKLNDLPPIGVAGGILNYAQRAG